MNTCSYGCNKKGLYLIGKNKRLCCSKIPQKCEYVINKNQSKRKNTLSKIDPLTNKTGYDKIKDKNREIASKKYNNIIDGLNGHQRAGIKGAKTLGIEGLNLKNKKSAKTKKETICENGLSIEENAIIKSLLSMEKICENGLSVKENAKIKRNATFSKIDEQTGYTKRKLQSLKAQETMKNKFENGIMTGYQWNYYKNSNLKYQGKNELQFLNNCVENKNIPIEDVNRGPTVKYIFENQNRYTYFDFQIYDIIYEIKSYFTLLGINNSLIYKNFAKFNEAIKKYTLIIVCDGYEFCFNTEKNKLISYLSSKTNNMFDVSIL